MGLEYFGVNGTRVEVSLPVQERIRKVLKDLTGEKFPRVEGLSKEMCLKWAKVLWEKRDEVWREDRDDTWKKYRYDFREGDEAFEFGRFYQFLLNCGGIKAVAD